MKLIIGLGNPGLKYADTRHNAGFIVLDTLRSAWNFDSFRFEKKFDAEISDGIRSGERVILAKPQTFMNRSGETVSALMSYFKINPENLVVIHDDLDIEPGKFKISDNSSAAGHNGVQSIMDSLGTRHFTRYRIGIEGAQRKKTRIIPGEVFVLKPFEKNELEDLHVLATAIADRLP